MEYNIWRWRMSTINHFVADREGLDIQVYRHRSWKRLGQRAPWRIIVFGDRYCTRRWFKTRARAKSEAEKIAMRKVMKLHQYYQGIEKQ